MQTKCSGFIFKYDFTLLKMHCQLWVSPISLTGDTTHPERCSVKQSADFLVTSKYNVSYGECTPINSDLVDNNFITTYTSSQDNVTSYLECLQKCEEDDDCYSISILSNSNVDNVEVKDIVECKVIKKEGYVGMLNFGDSTYYSCFTKIQTN